jgi:hypothetical protein
VGLGGLGVVACGSEQEFPATGTGASGAANDAGNPGGGNADPNADDTQGSDVGPVIPVLPEGAPQLIGTGSPDSVDIVELYAAPATMFCPGALGKCPGLAADLEFNPARSDELWVVYRRPYEGQPCNTPPKGQRSAPECSLLRSMVSVISGATSDSPRVELKEDGNSWHFMRLVTALAFADNDTFATVGEDRTGNYHDVPVDYMGPTWWSSDPAIFAQQFTTIDDSGEEVLLNGSHLDMLHASPFGMGIAHEKDHVFWVFNGQLGAIDRYDFKQPHEPGGEDHSDGTLHRYVTGELTRQSNVPSHMAFGPDRRYLYIADTGAGRVVRLDTQSGVDGGQIVVQDPQIADPRQVVEAELTELISPGVLKLPSGLDVYDDALLITDAQTGLIHLFDLDGAALTAIDTGFGPGALAGVSVGPDGRVYFVNWNAASVHRIERASP